jgi:hypothetical protein
MSDLVVKLGDFGLSHVLSTSDYYDCTFLRYTTVDGCAHDIAQHLVESCPSNGLPQSASTFAASVLPATFGVLVRLCALCCVA